MLFWESGRLSNDTVIKVIENETLNRSSQILQDVALALVKMASSFRGIACVTMSTKQCHIFLLTFCSSDGLDDQLRKLYRSHAPDSNPFGEDETPTPFDSLDPLIKVICHVQIPLHVVHR
jgi:hypothetical protein